MVIKITHAKQAPKWETLERIISEMIDYDGVLTRIFRPDLGGDYRAPGSYELTFRTPEKEYPIYLEVS